MTPRLIDRLLWPLTFGLPMRDAFLWPMQVAQAILGLGATYCVFSAAGGDIRHPLAADRPLYAAGFVFLALGLMAWLVAYEARATERRVTAREEEIRNAEIPLRMDSPYGLHVAERAVIAAALQVDRAQIPAEHPQYHDLMHAVDLLHQAVESGETMHPDVDRIYRRVTGSSRGGRVRHAVEQVVRAHGPISLPDIVDRLAMGGSWGRPISATGQLVRLMLRDPDDRNTPVAWLAPRQPEEPFQHRDNLTANV